MRSQAIAKAPKKRTCRTKTAGNKSSASKIDFFVHGKAMLGAGEANIDEERDWPVHRSVKMSLIIDI